jgi:N-acetyl-alpha-D-glucosaminyl L-malate synthase BshA
MSTTERLRIGITCYPTFGGSGIIATEIGLELARRGHRVHFICHDVPGRLDRFADNVFFHEVEMRDYPLFHHAPYELALASKMVEVATYQRLDLLHVHYAIPHAASAFLAAQILGPHAPRVVTTLHGTDTTLVGSDRSFLPITRFSIERSDGVTAPSQFLRRATYDKLALPVEVPIEVIPNFVDTQLYKPAEPREWQELARLFPNGTRTGGEPPPKLLIHTSNFRPLKRVDDVVRVFAEVFERANMPVRLVLVGDGPERSSVERAVHERGLGAHVCFLGKQLNFLAVLEQADVFLLPSESESFGLAALEALACGVPVVASDVGGLPEVVKHGETGFLSPVGDTGAMATHVLALLRDADRQARMGRAARADVEQRFQLAPLVTRYEEYYRKVLAVPPRRP